MGLKSAVIKPYAMLMAKKVRKWSSKPFEMQDAIFLNLLEQGKKTLFGKDHGFDQIHSYEDFKKHVPVKDYEGIKNYVEKIKQGELHVLWPGKPVYFAKTSGTTSGVKYIPITKDSLPNHVGSARNAVFCYIAETGNAAFFDGKMIFLSGSPELEKTGGVLTGRLSGIVNHEIPVYVKKNQLPSWETNCIEDWETKVAAIVEETCGQDLTLIGGIPSWVQMYFEKLQEKTGKQTIGEIFPHLQLYVYGGVNYEPYRRKFENALGRSVATIETYPASEGFIAFQDSQKEKGLLLQVNAGIFYEFIPANEVFSENPTRISLRDVDLEKNYAIVLNTNAGLWGYLIGDTVKFVSKEPYRIVVTGRTKHFISAFGEHVIAEEVEEALRIASEEEDVLVNEFHVAPMVNPPNGELPYHEWFIDFDKKPLDMKKFGLKVDMALQKKNIYYADLIEGKILQPLKITPVKKNAFLAYMKKEGKLGGQNKVARLGDNRKVADELEKE
jgi:hypothetical protein